MSNSAMRQMGFAKFRVSKTCTAVGIGLTLALALPTAARACSKGYFFGTLRPREVHFLGVARGDTIATGAGDVKYRVEAGHFGRSRDRAIYGQLVDVEQLGSRRPSALRALGDRVHRVILVPWDYAADCNPVPWSQTAQWIPPATRGLFLGDLRDSTHWIDGIPTLDVHEPEANPYPLAVERSWDIRMGSSGGGSGPDLTADQLFALYNLLPTSEELASSAEVAVAPLRRWRQDHADEATRFPAPGILRSVLWVLEEHRVRAIRSPVAGTYRLAILLPTRDSLVFFARTTLRPRDMLEAVTDSAREERQARGEDPQAEGYYLFAQIASSLDELPRKEAADFRHASSQSRGPVAVVEIPTIATRDSTVWRGSFDLIGAALRLAPPGALHDGIAAADSVLWKLIRLRSRSYASGYFVRRSNGSVRYSMTESYLGDPVLTVRGERVSLDYLSDP